tara:strand:+ start:1274 stop:1468 length:195 start_codon:yes stop_codon:yes gene_type:complete
MGYKSHAQRKAVHASKAEQKNAAVKLTKKQKKLDKNNNNKIDAQDLKMLRTGANPTIMMKYGKK